MESEIQDGYIADNMEKGLRKFAHIPPIRARIRFRRRMIALKRFLLLDLNVRASQWMKRMNKIG